ncbi:MAG: hypothetical protein MI723_13270 [Caulobacterales bacterium]|nr:hypothetical protein [Caulobacterales bacterium]
MIRSVIFTLVTLFTPPAERTDPDARMDALFVELAAAETPADAAFIAEEIEAIWKASGDASADLLMARADEAAAMGEFALSRRLIDGALELAPDFADAWAHSAAIAAASDDVSRAVEDLNQALVLEPRHYEALVGLGLLLERLEQDAGAYEAYQRALAIYPLHPEAGDLAQDVEREAVGREL